MVPAVTWRPLLEGADAQQAREAILEIARALESRPPASTWQRAERLLLTTYLTLTGVRPAGDEDIDRALEEMLEAAAAEPLRPVLHGGLVGAAWVLAHLGRLGWPHIDDDACAEVDGLLVEALGTPWVGRYDLVSGLVGIGVYALERRPSPRAAGLIGLVVDQLAQAARLDGEGACFWTEAALLDPSLAPEHPRGHADLGLCHGVAGVVGFLAAVCRLGGQVETGKARTLLAETERWLLARRLPPGGAASFPKWVSPGHPPQASRLAWCYGDPGIAAALLARDEAPARERALDLLRAVARCPGEETGVVDAILCHGSAGLGHLLNRAHQATGDPPLEEAARVWMRRTLAFRQPGEGLGGYLRVVQDPVTGARVPGEDPGLLTGVVGIALALLAAVTAVPPGWDRLLLLDVGGGGQAPEGAASTEGRLRARASRPS